MALFVCLSVVFVTKNIRNSFFTIYIVNENKKLNVNLQTCKSVNHNDNCLFCSLNFNMILISQYKRT